MDEHNPMLTNPVLIELMHNPCGGTDSSGLVGTGSINLEFSVNSVFVKPPFVEYPSELCFLKLLFGVFTRVVFGNVVVWCV